MKPTRYVRMKVDCVLVYPTELESLPPMAEAVGSGVLAQAIVDALSKVGRQDVDMLDGAKFTFSLCVPKASRRQSG